MRNHTQTEKETAPVLTLSGKLPLSLVLDSAEISYHPAVDEQPDLPVTPRQSVAQVTLPLPPVPEKKPVQQPEIPRSIPQENPKPTSPAPQLPPQASHAPAIQASVSPLVKPVTMAAFSGFWPQRIIGVVDRTYILAESANGLVLIDQHAAHERIMFEKILAQYSGGSAERQQLLIPETIELSRPMIKLLTGNKELFEKLGFDVESAGGTTVIVSSIPLVPSGHRPVNQWINDMLNELLESGSIHGTLPAENAAKAALCIIDHGVPEAANRFNGSHP
jgi:DNA mismatch repair protein MutL